MNQWISRLRSQWRASNKSNRHSWKIKKEQKNFSEKLVEVVLKKLVDYLRSAQKSASSHFDTGMMQLDTVEEDIEEEQFFTQKLLLGNKHIDQLGCSKFLSMTISEKERHCFLEWVTS